MNEKCLSLLIGVAVRKDEKFSAEKKSCVDERPKERPIGACHVVRVALLLVPVCIYNNDIF